MAKGEWNKYKDSELIIKNVIFKSINYKYFSVNKAREILEDNNIFISQKKVKKILDKLVDIGEIGGIITSNRIIYVKKD
ncbi:MAG: hypothetical protein EOL97_14675 [Spirochaetia bacterium]|nr:hypothetical protein [Spirochaetia bacterium]